MNLKINSEPHVVDENLNLSDLLKHLGMAGKPVVLELNEKAIFPREYDSTQLQENDSIEIIVIAAGG